MIFTLWGCTLLSSLSSSAGNQAAFSFLSMVTPQALITIHDVRMIWVIQSLIHLRRATKGIQSMDIPMRRTMTM